MKYRLSVSICTDNRLVSNTTVSRELQMVPTTTTAVADADAQKVLKLIDLLEDHDDVQKVWANFDISDEDMAAFEG